jgi:hypothetical protein
MSKSNDAVRSWESIGSRWVELGRLWEAQDAYERAGKELSALQLVTIARRCFEADRLDEAQSALELLSGLHPQPVAQRFRAA